jgi:glutathione synthase/RimK-type ligase-like ATP-grasp enzyme
MIDKSAEYRVHIFGNEHLVTQKRRRNGARDEPSYNESVRSVSYGWVQSVNNVDRLHTMIIEEIKSIVNDFGLDLCAVDLALDQDGTPYILELNTAPGIEHTTVRDFYVDGVISYYEAI